MESGSGSPSEVDGVITGADISDIGSSSGSDEATSSANVVEMEDPNGPRRNFAIAKVEFDYNKPSNIGFTVLTIEEKNTDVKVKYEKLTKYCFLFSKVVRQGRSSARLKKSPVDEMLVFGKASEADGG